MIHYGRRVVITGGGTGIGRAIARSLLMQGAQVLACGRRANLLSDIAEGLPVEAEERLTWTRCDITVASDVLELERGAIIAMGGVDGLVNNASSFGWEDTADGWEAALSVDLRGSVSVTQALMPHLLSAPKSSVVSLSSTLGIRAGPAGRPYAAAKAAMVNWSQSMALQFAPSGVRFNCVAPGAVEFPGGIWDTLRVEDSATYENELQGALLGRLGAPEDIADVVSFLLSDDSRWIVGQTLVVDGGQILK